MRGDTAVCHHCPCVICSPGYDARRPSVSSNGGWKWCTGSAKCPEMKRTFGKRPFDEFWRTRNGSREVLGPPRSGTQQELKLGDWRSGVRGAARCCQWGAGGRGSPGARWRAGRRGVRHGTPVRCRGGETGKRVPAHQTPSLLVTMTGVATFPWGGGCLTSKRTMDRQGGGKSREPYRVKCGG